MNYNLMLRRSITNLQSLAHDATFRQKLIVTSNNQGAAWKHFEYIDNL